MSLKVCAVSFITRRGYNEEDELDRRIAGTKDAMRMAYELGAPIVVNFIGRVPTEPQGPRWNLLVETLHDLARYGDHIGAHLAARTGSEDGATLARLLAALPEGGIGVDFDPAALIIGGHSPLESLTPLAKFVKHARARDAARDFAQGRGLETQLGRGTADFPTLAAALGDYGYHGYFTIERQQSADPQSDIANAVQFLKNML
jgi:sugar phosphate isomerase/epimerase